MTLQRGKHRHTSIDQAPLAENARPVIEAFPHSPGLLRNKAAYMKGVEEAYVTDAWHSLSIAGYRVTASLIERARRGSWNPEITNKTASGYWQAFQLVEQSIGKVLKGENPGAVAEQHHRAWYREMFAPSVTAGLLGASTFAGYRSDQVFIRTRCTFR